MPWADSSLALQAAFLLCQFISYIIPYNKGVAPQCNPFLFVVMK